MGRGSVRSALVSAGAPSRVSYGQRRARRRRCPRRCAPGEQGDRPFLRGWVRTPEAGERRTRSGATNGDNFVVDEVLYTGYANGALFGVECRKGTVSFRILHLIEFRDGRAWNGKTSGSTLRPLDVSYLRTRAEP